MFECQVGGVTDALVDTHLPCSSDCNDFSDGSSSATIIYDGNFTAVQIPNYGDTSLFNKQGGLTATGPICRRKICLFD